MVTPTWRSPAAHTWLYCAIRQLSATSFGTDPPNAKQVPKLVRFKVETEPDRPRLERCFLAIDLGIDLFDQPRHFALWNGQPQTALQRGEDPEERI